MDSILKKLEDILNSQIALIEKYAICQMELEEENYSEEAESLAKISGTISKTTENIKEIIGDCEILAHQKKINKT